MGKVKIVRRSVRTPSKIQSAVNAPKALNVKQRVLAASQIASAINPTAADLTVAAVLLRDVLEARKRPKRVAVVSAAARRVEVTAIRNQQEAKASLA